MLIFFLLILGGTISRTDSNSQYVESVVCKVNDLKENEMKVFEIGEEGKVLVVKQNGEFNAVGTKCTHYGAPLVSGALGDGRVRCPWHGACFNLKTGDIEDFPGFDSLPCYQVTVSEKGEVKVRFHSIFFYLFSIFLLIYFIGIYFNLFIFNNKPQN